jgi:hypothetical protein
MSYYEPDPKLMYDAAEQADPILKAQNQSAPRWLQGETHMGYRRRLAEKIQSHAPNCQSFKLAEAQGSAFDVLEKQIYDDARREALNPTNVPEGELREVKRIDQSGRPFSTFYGSPKVWMDTFNASNKKRLVGIRVANERGYHPSNVG